jgi:hypothetical protein
MVHLLTRDGQSLCDVSSPKRNALIQQPDNFRLNRIHRVANAYETRKIQILHCMTELVCPKSSAAIASAKILRPSLFKVGKEF